MDERELLEKRLEELARESYEKTRFTFSDFLGEAELDVFFQNQRELSYACPTLFGGVEHCERKMLRFGDPRGWGYEEEFPIVCLHLVPRAPKFADQLTHRDVLGALMNLGIKRSMLGDLVLKEGAVFVFCHEKIAPFLLENLKKAKHTELCVSLCEQLPQGALFSTRETTVQCASFRVDLVIAKHYALSRSEAQTLIAGGKLFVGGRTCTDGSRPLKEGETVSVRGYGKFIFRGISSLSRKGELNLLLEEYV